MSTTRVTQYVPFTGEPVDIYELGHLDVDHIEVESFECVLCGKVKEIEEAATSAPPDVCWDCIDAEAEAMAMEQPPVYAREVA